MIDGQGMPLWLVLQQSKDRYVIDWEDLVQDVRKHGWNLQSWLTRTENDVADVMGPEYRDVLMPKLREIVARG